MLKQPEINLSQVIAEVFRAKTRALSAQNGSKNMSNLIQRLKASKLARENAERADGVEAGRTWATEHAEFNELHNLSEWWDTASEDGRDVVLTTQETDAFGASHQLACVIRGECCRDRKDSDQFWEEAIGDDNGQRHSDRFVRGFVEGALQVWNAVKDKL